MRHRRVGHGHHGPVLGLLLAATATADDAGCPRWRAAFAAMPIRPIALVTPVGPVTLRARAPATPEQRAGGFQCATPEEIRRNQVLFDFGGEVATFFHMQHVPVALDIAFAKADGRLFAIVRMDPNPAALYGVLGAFRYALEAEAGFFAARGIVPGTTRLVLDPSEPGPGSGAAPSEPGETSAN